MAQQLLELRSPAAYDGVEGWARKHASTDAGSLGWLVLGPMIGGSCYAAWREIFGA